MTFFEPLKFIILFLIVMLESLKYEPPSHDFTLTLDQAPNMLFEDKIPFRTV